MQVVLNEFVRLAVEKHGANWNGSNLLTIDNIRLHVRVSMSGKRVCLEVDGRGIAGFPDAFPYGQALELLAEKLASEKLARKLFETG